jgi:ferrous iron transport protein B
VADALLDPLGIGIGDVSDQAQAAEQQGVTVDTYSAMQGRFDGQIGAFAYLLFILLYMPCVAAVAAVYREAGKAWAIFIGAWTTGLAFLFSTAFYQAATWNQHPQQTLLWLSALVFTILLVVLLLWGLGKYYRNNGQTVFST